MALTLRTQHGWEIKAQGGFGKDLTIKWHAAAEDDIRVITLTEEEIEELIFMLKQ